MKVRTALISLETSLQMDKVHWINYSCSNFKSAGQ